MLSLFYLYLANSLNISLFIILLLLLEPIMRKRFSAVCIFRICLILLVALLVPLRIGFNKPILSIHVKQQVKEGSALLETEEKTSYLTDKNYNHAEVTAKSTAISRNIRYSESRHKLSKHLMNFINSDSIYRLWVFAAITILFLNVRKNIKYKKHIKRLYSIPDQNHEKELIEMMKKLQENRILKKGWSRICFRNIRVRKCSAINSPMTFGYIHPEIVVPDAVYSKDELHYILQHELIHIYRMDSLLKIICLIALAVNWYNPLGYLLSAKFDSWSEASCDELVLSHSSKSGCYEYGRLLLRCSAYEKVNDALTINFYGGKKEMKQRLLLIMDRSKKSSGKLLLALMLIVISTTSVIAMNQIKVKASNDIQEKNTVGSADNMTEANKDGKIVTETNTSYEEIEVSSDQVQDGEAEADQEKKSELDALREMVVSTALNAEDTPYLWGGNDLSTGVDCSGFVQAVYKIAGYDLPRTSREQLEICEKVSLNELQPGDIIFYADSENKVNHDGIYIGDNKVIHAKNFRMGVEIEDMNYRVPSCAGRLIAE